MKILGICTHHDSSVCVLVDGLIDYYSKEERLTRKKRDKYPTRSINKAIELYNGEFDYVIISSWNYTNEYIITLTEQLKKKLPKSKIINECSQHHLFHANMAFFNSQFEEALCFVADRVGAPIGNLIECESIYQASYPNVFVPIMKNYYNRNMGEHYDEDNYRNLQILQDKLPECDISAHNKMSITKVYESATTLIGEHPLENGKTMGLSSFGKNWTHKDLFSNNIPIAGYFMHLNKPDNPVLLKEHYNTMIDGVPTENYELYADYAFQVQKQTMKVVKDTISKYVSKTGIKNVVISGGYGLNVLTNQYLIKNMPDINFYFEPVADDSGISIGAALFLHRSITGDDRKIKYKNLFYNNINHSVRVEGEPCTEKDIAKLLSDGKIVAVYNEMAEVGPRALGNRSILYDARDKMAKDIVNVVKNREWYRPFAGSILKEYANDYFDMLNQKESPNMTIAFDSKTDKIPGVIHVDNTCRVQTVDEDIPHFYKLLKEFNNITGVPVLLNTSFNVAGEALVETVEDAIQTFEKTDIDVLWFPEKQIMMTK